MALLITGAQISLRININALKRHLAKPSLSHCPNLGGRRTGQWIHRSTKPRHITLGGTKIGNKLLLLLLLLQIRHHSTSETVESLIKLNLVLEIISIFPKLLDW